MAPGNEDFRFGPLCPWTTPAHGEEGWYHDAGGHDRCMEMFRRTIGLDGTGGGDPARIRTGRMVLVEGPARSGKTSLIHRCVHEVREAWARPEFVTVCDTTRVGMDGQLYTSPQTRSEVATRVIDQFDKQFEPHVVEHLHTMVAAADRVYDGISRRMDDDQLALVLLPELEPLLVPDPLTPYDACLRQGVIFFAERTTTAPSTPSPRSPGGPPSRPPLVLRLGHLTKDEALGLVTDRLHVGVQPDVRPAVSDETIIEILKIQDDAKAVGWLVSTFQAVFDRRASGEFRPDDVRWIEYDEVVNALLHTKGQS